VYESLEIHRSMLRDTVRTEAYRRALAELVRPGDVVIDVGAGTGILSLMAAQAGAAHVYAVERGPVAHVAAELAERNGVAGRVTVLRADVERVRLPRPADVIVSEWLGVYAVDENLLAPVLTTRDRWLRPSGRLLPDGVVSWLAPVWIDALDHFHGAPYGLDLAPIAPSDPHEIAWSRDGLAPDAIRARPLPLWRIDLASFPAWRAREPFRAALAFEAEAPSTVNGLAAWFQAGFSGAGTLSNAPGAPRTHWGQFVFPLQRPRAVRSGDRIEVRFSCIPAGPGFCQHAWSARVAGGAWEHHDTRLGAGPLWREL
jgi:SAM-dependent methyltransferase